MTKRRRRRRRWLPRLLALAALCALLVWWSNRSLQTQRFTYASLRQAGGGDRKSVV